MACFEPPKQSEVLPKAILSFYLMGFANLKDEEKT